MNSTKHLKKKKITTRSLRSPSSSTSRLRSSLSRPDVVGCGQEVAERVKKTTSVPETKKKEELSMKLLDDPKIPTARQNS
jgi:hypothetical protein